MQHEQLYHKLASGQLTPEEREAFSSYRDSLTPEELAAFMYGYEEMLDLQADFGVNSDPAYAQVKRCIEAWEGADGNSNATDSVMAPIHRVPSLRAAWFRYAVVLLLITGTATYLYQINRPQKDITQKKPTIQPADIQPGGNKAILTLSDGSTIALDSATIGALANQGSTRVIKLDAGTLTYQGIDASGQAGYNTITTPNGGQYQIVLSDGTKVWLNAASSVRFPTSFTGDRTIEIAGESYLEVAANKNKPFYVKTGATTIQVLGTTLNINAYESEASTRTTLVNGSIQVSSGSKRALLIPGQQAVTTHTIPLQVLQADLKSVTAWKDGLFNFEGMGVRELMRQVERWYNVTVLYKGAVPNVEFVGTVKRNLPLGELLETLQRMGIQYKLDNRTLTILP